MGAPEHPSGRVVALDLGEVRTGVAISDAGAVLARPLEVVPSQRLREYLQGLVEREDVTEVVVGVPKTLGGETGFQARKALEEIEGLREALPGVRFVERDERLTTRLAALGGAGRKKRGRGKSRERVDHLAAARILQEHLDSRRGSTAFG